MTAIDQTVKFVLNEWAQTQVAAVADKPSSFSRAKNIYKASLDFEGAFNGSCSIFIPEELALYVTQKVLGETGAQDSIVIQDTLRELVNIMTGNLLSTCYGQELRFDLALPNVTAGVESSTIKNKQHTRFYEIGTNSFALVLTANTNTEEK